MNSIKGFALSTILNLPETPKEAPELGDRYFRVAVRLKHENQRLINSLSSRWSSKS
jgi:histidinol-phosphate/aromatic aminotransferase/cobyric acid decarboxylase-like protein